MYPVSAVLLSAGKCKCRIIAHFQVSPAGGLEPPEVISKGLAVVAASSIVMGATCRSSPGELPFGSAKSHITLLQFAITEAAVAKSALGISGFLGDDIDYAVHSVDAPGNAGRAANYLNSFDIL